MPFCSRIAKADTNVKGTSFVHHESLMKEIVCHLLAFIWSGKTEMKIRRKHFEIIFLTLPIQKFYLHIQNTKKAFKVSSSRASACATPRTRCAKVVDHWSAYVANISRLRPCKGVRRKKRRAPTCQQWGTTTTAASTDKRANKRKTAQTI